MSVMQRERATERLTARLTPTQAHLIEDAAASLGENVSAFTVESAIARAHDVLASRTNFVLDSAKWNEFVAILERPAQRNEALARLLAQSDPWDQAE